MPRSKKTPQPKQGALYDALVASGEVRPLGQTERGGVSREHPRGPADSVDALVSRVFFDESITLRVVPDRTGTVWYKACIRTRAFPRHYLLTAHPSETPFSEGLRVLAEKIDQFHQGTLKPSPDRWQ